MNLLTGIRTDVPSDFFTVSIHVYRLMSFLRNQKIQNMKYAADELLKPLIKEVSKVGES